MSDIVRIDRYSIAVNGHSVRATPEQEAKIRLMDDEAIARFLKIMGTERSNR